MRLIPKTRCYTCFNCFKTFFSIFNISDIRDQREHKRYYIKDGVNVRLNPHMTELGPVINMSLSGLSFFYTTNQPKRRGRPLISLYNKNKSLFIDDISFEVRSKVLVNNDSPGEGKPLKRIGIQFKNLDKNKKRKIKSFIHSYNK